MIAREGTGDYRVTVPAGGHEALPWRAALRSPLPRRWRRIAGHRPWLLVEPFVRDGRPLARLVLHDCHRWVLWLRRSGPSTHAWGLAVDPGVVECLRPGDVLHLSRTGAAGTGLSIVRDGTLVLAAGAVGVVPLGRDVEVVPGRDPGIPSGIPGLPLASGFGGPVFVRVGEHAETLTHGVVTVGGYTCRVLHGRLAGIPGTDASVAISRDDACDHRVAESTARLLENDWRRSPAEP